MKDLDQHKKIAVLIDADNAQLSKLPLILEELSSHGHVVTKRAYGDWSVDSLKNWKTALNELAIQPVQQFAYTRGKNATDASMIIDAMDLLYSKKFDAFALISSDSDFTKLASRLREDEIYVFGFGEHKTPTSFRNACDDFLLTENLAVDEFEEAPARPSSAKPEKAVKSPKQQDELPEIVRLLRRAYDHAQDDQGWAHLSAAASFLKRAKSDFDPRTYGAKKFSDLFSTLGDYFELRRHTATDGIMAYRPIREGKK
ncbi:NYN domain-containing protein [Marinobacter nanhaiticus D15-8W]|uniref:NYN domain-containing protein n=1 Tax=Marinobacter nanhaiticus D15-8W TaxID=626887 RepID=N6X565_9GAMM|nr:NYN domain-containing protein [Marinobacter nanhaiticus]ENO16198.1 NYN domain-containing protein [Marinobacter nanhaiticus D15-8W]BES72946.1 NYN domain-containing protein [Marinobacter nanhaiticus D15-8W]